MDHAGSLKWRKSKNGSLLLEVGKHAQIIFTKSARWRAKVRNLTSKTPAEKKWVDTYFARPLARILNGDLILHGALVGKKGKTYLILAPSGTGKSTLTAHLVHNGWTCLTDDMTSLALNKRGVFGKGIRPSISLDKKSHKLLSIPSKASTDAKASYRLSPKTKVLRIDKIIYLQTHKDWRTTELTRADAANILLRSSWRPPLKLDKNMPRFLEQIAKLVEKVPCAMVQYPKRPASLSRMRRYLER